MVLHAQTGVVENAALAQSSPYGSPAERLVVPAPAPANVVSPRMLAVLSYGQPVIFPGFPVPVGGILAYPPLPAPPTVATLSIRPAGAVSRIPVAVTNLAAGAITFVVPAGVPLGGAELLYKIDDQPTQWTTINVVQSSFAFFRTEGTGPAIAQTIAADGSTSGVGLATPAEPGQTLVLTGSGLGYGSTVSATIGGIAAPVTYAGPSATQAGHDRILIPIPAGVPDGCYIPVSFTYNLTTVTTTISNTPDGSPCKHPWGLSAADMKTLDDGGALADAQISLSTEFRPVTPAAVSRGESASMTLNSINAAGIAGYFALPGPASGVNCAALTPASLLGVLSGNFVSVSAGSLPDIGKSIALQNSAATLTLPGAAGFYSWSPPAPVDGPLSSPPPPAIAGGNWTWQSSGGKDLPPSSFNFTLPAPIQLNGSAPFVIRLGQDQTITWNGAALDPAATVSVYLNGSSGVPVACTAPAAAGSLTIPAALLSSNLPDSIGSLGVSLNEPPASRPHATLKQQNGATLLLLVFYSGADSRPVVFQ
jgi:uncharacterized protein (TIGR03437 family)